MSAAGANQADSSQIRSSAAGWRHKVVVTNQCGLFLSTHPLLPPRKTSKQWIVVGGTGGSGMMVAAQPQE